MDIDSLNAYLQEEFAEEERFKYQSPYHKSRYYEIDIERIEKYLDEGGGGDRVFFLWLQEFFLFHCEYSVYALLERKGKDEAKYHLLRAARYGYLIIEYGSRACGCFVDDRDPFIVMHKAVFMTALQWFLGEEKRFFRMAGRLIDSLNGQGCIIKKGYAKATVSWYVLELYSRFLFREIALHPKLRVQLDDPYAEALSAWDSEDVELVEKLVMKLCDAHVAQAHLNHAERQEEELDSLKYHELFIPALYVLPYEVIVWLKFRAQKGLPNPAQIEHPLWNHPYGKWVHSLQPPWPDTGELPYVQDLLGLIKKRCPGKMGTISS